MELENCKREIKYLHVSSLKPFEKNPKRHPKTQINMLIKSINEFGFTSPILISQDNLIIAGHARVQAAKKIGLKEVPTIFIDLPYPKAVAYVLADNRLNELAETDDKLVAEILKESMEIQGFDFEATGYTEDDYTQLLKDIAKHDKMYNVGEGATDKHIDFIKGEDKALDLDQAAIEIFTGKKNILVSYSGGKDSTFALLWALKNFPDMKIYACFSDTGVEFPGMTSHVWEVCQHLKVECVIVKPKIDVWITWAKDGKFFAKMFPKCQEMLIFDPLAEFFLTFSHEDTVIIDGSRGDQRRATSKKTKTSGAMDKRLKNYLFYHPAYDIDYETEEAVIKSSGVPMWEGYAMGFKRSACWCCPGQSSVQAYMLSKNYPGLVDVIRRWEKKLDMPLDFVKGVGIDHLIEVGKNKVLKGLPDEDSED